jgi:hypothetical protein
MARLMETVDAGTLVRGTRPAGASPLYDTFASFMWRHDVFLTPQSPVDTKTLKRLGLTARDTRTGNGQFLGRECEDTAVSTAIGI